ncbi:transposase [Clostridium perfringens]|uniref:helix-turn-helix domain-containing protein n=1 Tax=Clostridium perfringens TaxID=1502 RepID=UPI0013D178D3|nr:helix-turn-helix domain-containing protein [Clostridium perfringens]ELC8405607.1 helix-turn-helix domain-containing protein [Clostridium perfringens]KAF2785059.1 transposase [Clostridium perfringens]
MGRGKKYTEDYNEMISDLYKSGMTISEISSEYGIAKSTINVWIKSNKEIKISEDEVITLKEVAKLKKEMARIKEEN